MILYVSNGNINLLQLKVNSDVTVGALFKMPDVTSAKILVADGTSYEEVAVSGDISIASNGAVTIAATSVENSMVLAGSIADTKLNTTIQYSW